MTDSPRARNPVVAAALSFVVPGAGQAYLGRRRLALLLGLPAVLLVIGIALLLTVFADDVRNDLFSDRFLTAALIVDVAVLLWRLAAIGEAGFGGWRGWLSHLPRLRRAGAIGLVVVLLGTTVAMHTWAGVVLVRLNDTLSDVFSGDPRGPRGDGNSDPGGPLNEPAYSWDGTERVTFLLLGIDAAPGREAALTDTILVVSVDPVAREAVMVSIPRDTGFIPLPDRSVYPDGVYPNKINGLASEAGASPEIWCPDLPVTAAEACGLRTLERTVALYLGLPIQYFAHVDLAGFAELIDAVGGVTLCLEGTLVDPDYSGPGWDVRGIELPEGCTEYDGARALAYSRIRHGWIVLPDGTTQQQNDFLRADRQQRVLLELRREFARMDFIFELPSTLNAVGRTVSTDFPRSMAGDLASLLPLITGPDIEREVLGLPEYVDPPIDPAANYLLVPRRDAIRAGMQELLGPGVTLEGWYLGSHDDGPPDAAT
jgi:LCP family protein required for cell wall assembly